MRWMDRWAARAQRKSDERQARWQERQEEKARSGRMTAMDRWAAGAQRKSDERAARWPDLEPLRQLVASGPVEGPDGGGGGWLSVLLLVSLLISETIWWLAFHRTYTVHVRTNGRPPIKISVRLPNEVAAYKAAVILVSRFPDEGPAALQSWRAALTASI
jgi:hypothetical protein